MHRSPESTLAGPAKPPYARAGTGEIEDTEEGCAPQIIDRDVAENQVQCNETVREVMPQNRICAASGPESGNAKKKITARGAM